MSRLMTALLLVASCVVAAGHAQDTPAPPSGRISIDFVAVDQKGQPVMDLKQEEVEIWIGHFQAPIARFTSVSPSADDQPARSIVLLLDDVTVNPATVPRARDAAKRVVSRIQPRDQLVLVTLSGVISETSADTARLRRALDAYNVRAAGLDQIDILMEHVLETVASVAQQMREAPGVRKTMIAIGSGVVFDRPLLPGGFGRDTRPQWIEAMRSMAFAHMHLYVIDPLGVGSVGGDSGKSGFADATGGLAFLNTNDFDGAVNRILRDASNYYVVSVSDPPVGRKSDLRDLEVRVRRPGVRILASRSIPGGLDQ